jgi:hypothetical protein
VSSEPGQGSTFTFTLPVYSLAKLLAPVITHKELLRPCFVLSRVELTSLLNPPRGNWRETCRQCMETVRRCVYLDKDLVLPPMGTSGAAETIFIVASTDLQQSGIMTLRIREQLERMADLRAKGTVTITTLPIELPPDIRSGTLEQQVQAVSDSVAQMVLTSMDTNRSFSANKDVN